jgi:hypothetical protein
MLSSGQRYRFRAEPVARLVTHSACDSATTVQGTAVRFRFRYVLHPSTASGGGTKAIAVLHNHAEGRVAPLAGQVDPPDIGESGPLGESGPWCRGDLKARA